MPINKSLGHTTGMGVMQYFASLFEANELVAQNRKLTDEQILVECQKEFPGREIWKDFSDGSNKSKRYTVNGYRIKYNRGVMTRGVPPKLPSFRYGYDPIRRVIRRVDPRYGMTALLPEEVSQISKAQAAAHAKAIKIRFGKGA